MTTPAPFVVIIAGPNGSGKSTLTRFLVDRGVDLGEYVNPDEIAATLVGPYDQRVRDAQVEADRRRDACLAERRSFGFETVMSHPSKVELLEAAREAGWRVRLFFVSTDDPRINVDRVATRVQQGGHDVPTDRILERYRRTLALLPRALNAAHEAVLFDNSGGPNDPMRRVLIKRGGRISRIGWSPAWLRVLDA